MTSSNKLALTLSLQIAKVSCFGEESSGKLESHKAAMSGPLRTVNSGLRLC